MSQVSQETCKLVQETCLGVKETGKYNTHRRTPLTQKMYELICAKISIFPSNMAQETIQFGQECAGNVS